jgi:gluconokinase
MASFPLRSPAEKVGGIVYFGRMLDKIRVHARGELPADYQPNMGKGFDGSCIKFLRVNYEDIVAQVKQGRGDEEVLQWCFENGYRPSEEEIFVWNEWMRKRGWNDEITPILARRKAEAGLRDRNDIQTMFAFIDADEGRAQGSQHS